MYYSYDYPIISYCYLGKACHERGEDLIVEPKLVESAESKWLGYVQYLWSGLVAKMFWIIIYIKIALITRLLYHYLSLDMCSNAPIAALSTVVVSTGTEIRLQQKMLK